jgi:hypothetical protein
MMVKTPFFISPAYSVPRMVISRRSKLRQTLVLRGHAIGVRVGGEGPALKMV